MGTKDGLTGRVKNQIMKTINSILQKKKDGDQNPVQNDFERLQCLFFLYIISQGTWSWTYFYVNQGLVKMDTYSLKFMILTFYQKKAEETSAYAVHWNPIHRNLKSWKNWWPWNKIRWILEAKKNQLEEWTHNLKGWRKGTSRGFKGNFENRYKSTERKAKNWRKTSITKTNNL